VASVNVTLALAGARERIERAGRDPDTVRVVAVTKGFGPEAVHAALAAGLADVGENYAQELVAKAGTVGADAGAGTGTGTVPRWHFLGAVQRNKVSRLAPVVSLWQAVDRIEAGRAIARRAPGAAVLVEVDLTAVPGRPGCPPASVPALVDALRGEGLDVRGLMAVGPPGPPERSRAGFRLVADLSVRLGLPERSMGMTDDLEVAVAEGATMVRLGRALFGPRPARADLRR